MEQTLDAGLIKNTSQEEVLIKIRSMRNQNLTAVQREETQNLRKLLSMLFVRLVKRQYGLDRTQLLSFSDNEIEFLQQSLYCQIKARAIIEISFIWLFGLIIPLVGWFMIIPEWGFDPYSGPLAYHYRRCSNKLRKMTGDKYLSAKWFRELDS